MRVTLKNYPTAAANADTSVFSPEQVEIHQLLLEFGEDIGDAVFNNPDVRAQVNIMLDLLNSQGGGSQAKNPEAEVRKAGKKPAAKKPAAKKPAAAPKAPKEVTPKASKPAKEVPGGNVRGISAAVTLVRAFVSLLDKKVPGRRVTALMRRVTQAMLNDTIHAGTPHGKDVEEVQNLLVEAVNGLKTAQHPEKQVTVELDDDDQKARLVGVAGGEKVFGSVAVLRAFVRLTGKEVSKDQIANLLKRTESSQVKASDPFQAELKEIQAVLKKAKPGAILSPTSVGLSGTRRNRLAALAGIVRAIDRHTPTARASAKKKASRPAAGGRRKATTRRRKTAAK